MQPSENNLQPDFSSVNSAYTTPYVRDCDCYPSFAPVFVPLLCLASRPSTSLGRGGGQAAPRCYSILVTLRASTAPHWTFVSGGHSSDRTLLSVHVRPPCPDEYQHQYNYASGPLLPLRPESHRLLYLTARLSSFPPSIWYDRRAEMIRATNLFFSISTAASSVGAVQYALNSAQLTANQPFNDAFVSYSIEFSSFPDFAGEPTLLLL